MEEKNMHDADIAGLKLGGTLKHDGAKDRPSRDKDWKELDDQGKIERLRLVLRNQEALIERMGKYLTELIEHDHIDGKMVKRIDHPGSESYGSFHYRKYEKGWL